MKIAIAAAKPNAISPEEAQEFLAGIKDTNPVLAKRLKPLPSGSIYLKFSAGARGFYTSFGEVKLVPTLVKTNTGKLVAELNVEDNSFDAHGWRAKEIAGETPRKLGALIGKAAVPAAKEIVRYIRRNLTEVNKKKEKLDSSDKQLSAFLK